MKDDRINVGIIIGGRSVECEISLISGLQAYFAIDKKKYNPTILYLDKNNHLFVGKSLTDLNTYKTDLKKDLEEVFLTNQHSQVYYHTLKHPRKKYPIDVFVPVVHGYGVEDGTISGYLDMYQAIYTSSQLISSAIIQDKATTKALLDKYQLPNIAYQIVNEGVPFHLEIELPVIIKPAYLGSSIGIQIVKEEAGLTGAINEAFKYTDRLVIEKALTSFKEYNCAIFKDRDELVLSCIEEVTHTSDILSFVDKYENELNKLSNASNRIIPALIDDELANKIQNLTRQLYLLFNLSGVVRIDYLYDDINHKLYINEINNIPGSLAFYLFEPLGLTFTELLSKLIHNAIINKSVKNQKITTFKSNILTKKSSKLMNK